MPRLQHPYSLRRTRALVLLFCGSLLAFHPSQSLYLPGIAPTDYYGGSDIAVYANRLTSTRSKVPFPYYSLPFCPADVTGYPTGFSKSDSPPKSRPVNLGQILLGEKSQPTPFVFRMLQPIKCAHLCSVSLSQIPKRLLTKMKARIRQDYSVRLNADNMPLVTRGRTRTGAQAFRFGYKLGFVGKRPSGQDSVDYPPVYINNHLQLTVLYSRAQLSKKLQDVAEKARVAAGADPQPDALRVVGFEVRPMSVADSVGGGKYCDSVEKALAASGEKGSIHVPMVVAADSTIGYTYSLAFEESDLLWATRWDPLLEPGDEMRQIQWFSIVNSLMIAILLTGLVGIALFRTVLQDFVRYRIDTEDNESDDNMTGWKLLHGDVFRPPAHPEAFAICIGSGAQILLMTCSTLFFALAGFLSPANRGGLVTAMLSLFIMASGFAGFVCARVYGDMDAISTICVGHNGSTSTSATSGQRRMVTWGVATMIPGVSFGSFFMLNLCFVVLGSSAAVGFGGLLVLLLLWFGISVPLVFVGSYLAYRIKGHEAPVRTNAIARAIPRSGLLGAPLSIVIPAGAVPFASIFMEMVFLLNAINQGGFYYMFGALFSVLLILSVTCCELSIVLTYFLLNAENWSWEWPAFGCTASSGLFVFAYAMYYISSQPPVVDGGLGAGLLSWVMYATYMALISAGFALMTGFLGYSASNIFVRKIYRHIRID